MAKTKMRILIDTHIFLWSFGGIRDSIRFRDFLSDREENEFYVSHVTAWEISIKYGNGKLDLPERPENFFPDRMKRAGFYSLPIEVGHVLNVHDLPPIHRDPFDRLLIAQARVENLNILTADPHFSKYQINTIDFNSFI